MSHYSLDLQGLKSPADLHDRLAQVFAFPDYYGGNWDAFDDCIADLAPPVSIVLSGFEGLRFVLPREAKLLLKCLHSAAENASPDKFVVTALP